MSANSAEIPFYLHTLKSLCFELVNGRPVQIDDKGASFQLISNESRNIFEWYLQRQNKWSQNVFAKEIEVFADLLDKTPPELISNESPKSASPKHVIHLKSVRAHRFAGIHRYGTLTEAPEDFFFEFVAPFTLIEGENASGKTSFVNAICWCLTGFVCRSQRAPETAEEAINVALDEQMHVDDILEHDEDKQVTFDIVSITPLPSAEVINLLHGRPIPLDTWVELEFVDSEGTSIGKIRRAVRRNSKNKIEITEPDFSRLGIDPIAREIGTRMPAIIPYIQLGKKSELGTAVAALTGIKPLQSLSRHAAKAKVKFKSDLVKDRQTEIYALDKDYLRTRNELLAIIEQNPSIQSDLPIPEPGLEEGLDLQLHNLLIDFEHQQERMLEQSKLILGDAFDPRSRESREDLIENVGPAIGQIEIASLTRLKSASRLNRIKSLTTEDIRAASTLMFDICNEAKELAELAGQPDRESRLRLYAKIAGWIKTLAVPHDVANCPVCQTNLSGKVDPVTKSPIVHVNHLKGYIDHDQSYLEKTIVAWTRNAHERLAHELTEPLRVELSMDLPNNPWALVRTAYIEELFAQKPFMGSLSPMKTQIARLNDTIAATLPQFDPPNRVKLPERIRIQDPSLERDLNRIALVIAFSIWRNSHSDVCRDAHLKIIGTVQKRSDSFNQDIRRH